MEKSDKIVNLLARLINKSREKTHNLSLTGKKKRTLLQIIQAIKR